MKKKNTKKNQDANRKMAEALFSVLFLGLILCALCPKSNDEPKKKSKTKKEKI